MLIFSQQTKKSCKKKKQVVRLDCTSRSDWVNHEPVMESIFLHMKTGPFQLGQGVAFILEPET